MSETNTDVFVTLDLDRTLLNTELYSKTVDRGDTTISPGALLNPGARELLDGLTARGIAYGIVTYEDELGRQLPKLVRAGIDGVPHLIITTPNKAQVIRRWWDGSSFRMPPELTGGRQLKAQMVWVLDDKAVAFADSTADTMRGFLYRPVRVKLRANQKGEVPAAVKEIQQLTDVLPYLDDHRP